jgi:uncharacterized protein YbbK (DUF523 family)
MKLTSACLLGIRCNWRGDKLYKNVKAIQMAMAETLIPVCPEQLGGLHSPRPQMEISGGDGNDVLDGVAKVITIDGVDVTANVIAGAEAVLKLAREKGASVFIGKARSPSCGCGKIYDGSYTSKTIAGDGVTVAQLKRNGVAVITEDEL